MSKNVVQVIEGKWLEWKNHERWICCDCSLAHSVEYRRRKGRLEVRMYRDNRSTSAYRRHGGIKITVKKK